MKIPSKKCFGSQYWSFGYPRSKNDDWHCWYIQNSDDACRENNFNIKCKKRGFFKWGWKNPSHTMCLICGIDYIKQLISNEGLLAKAKDDHEGLKNILANINKFLKKYSKELNIDLDDLL